MASGTTRPGYRMPPSGAAAALSMRAAGVVVANDAVREALDLWNIVDPMTLLLPRKQAIAVFGPWLRQLAALVERARHAAVATAEEGYNEVRTAVLGEVPPYRLPAIDFEVTKAMRNTLFVTSVGRMRHLYASGMTPAQAHRNAFPQLAGVVTKQTADAAREAVTQATRDDSEAVGWARVTRPKACAWCLMLASRGAVYHSEQDAARVTGGERGRTRGTQAKGNEYHDDCRCFAVPVFAGEQGLPELNRKMAEAWSNSTVGLGGKEALAAFRAYTGAR
jgi:hypothetical protein